MSTVVLLPPPEETTLFRQLVESQRLVDKYFTEYLWPVTSATDDNVIVCVNIKGFAPRTYREAVEEIKKWGDYIVPDQLDERIVQWLLDNPAQLAHPVVVPVFRRVPSGMEKVPVFGRHMSYPSPTRKVGLYGGADTPPKGAVYLVLNK